MSKKLSRRRLLSQGSQMAAGAAALGGLVGCASSGKSAGLAAAPSRRSLGANDKINVAIVGCGGMGWQNLKDFMKSQQVNVLATCDVEVGKREEFANRVEKELGQRPPTFEDYRAVIDLPGLDALIVATPDHWHAIPMIAAVAAGKDVYVEKPCCHNIVEGQAMVDAAAKYKAVVQVGTQQRSAQHMQEAREFIRSGKLGTISMTETYTWGNEAPEGMGNAPDEAVPQGVNYEMWLGPAPLRPFNRRRWHGSFRWYYDYAAGMVGDWNVHLQDIIMWTLGSTAPRAVSTSGGKYVLPDDRDTPDTMLSTYEFDPGPFTPKGYVQLYTMRKASGPPWSHGGYGMVFHGSNGKLHLRRTDWEVVGDFIDWGDPNKGRRVEGVQKPGSEDHPAHVLNFLDCMRTRQKPIASIDEHFKTVTACHLANVSYKARGGNTGHSDKIYWDADRLMCFRDPEHRTVDKEATAQLTREYRKGYELPKV